jgi:hypothetical protein
LYRVQVKDSAEELSQTAAKTGSQADSMAEQATASSQAPGIGTDTQHNPAEASGAPAGTPGTSQGTAGSREQGKAAPESEQEQEQEPDQAEGSGASARAAGALSIMDRLRSMASIVHREVGALFAGRLIGPVEKMQARKRHPPDCLGHCSVPVIPPLHRGLRVMCERTFVRCQCAGFQVAAAVLPENTTSSATRAYDESLRGDHVNTSTGIAVAPETRWQKQWKDMQDKVPAGLAVLLAI